MTNIHFMTCASPFDIMEIRTLVAGEVSTLHDILLRAAVKKDANTCQWGVDLGGVVGVVADDITPVHTSFNGLPLNSHLTDCCQT